VAAASLTACTSVPSTCTAAMPMRRGAGLAPGPAVILPLSVVAEMRLSSHTNSTGSW
jgi:hypothetical protein